MKNKIKPISEIGIRAKAILTEVIEVYLSQGNPVSSKLISEIDKALIRIKDNTYGYCLDTADQIGLKRLMARPIAKYTIAAQEKHEKDEKVHADD